MNPVQKYPHIIESSACVPKVTNNIDKKPPFYSFVSFLIVLVTPLNEIPESSKA